MRPTDVALGQNKRSVNCIAIDDDDQTMFCGSQARYLVIPPPPFPSDEDDQAGLNLTLTLARALTLALTLTLCHQTGDVLHVDP